uniref:Fucosyltransferase C-terminal domain-containing protein n=1 Tax=viral metagenome TaxID=1070528 RepID=A0A6C0B681_9ZZZZ
MPYFTNSYWLDVSKLTPTSDTRAIAVDTPNAVKPKKDIMLIVLQCEPNAIMNHREAYVQNHDKYDMILTFDDEVLKACPNARLCLPACTWIRPEVYNSIDTERKKTRISSITGSKNMGAPGHSLRQFFYMNQLLLRSHFTWFRSSAGSLLPEIQANLVVGKDSHSKDILFLDYQFSLVIENSRQKNYFSEKLIDCLITKTIPVYWGCPNISDWFDTRGWIILESESLVELRQKTLIMPNYNDYRDSIEANYQKARTEFTSQYPAIQRAINLGVATLAPEE